MVALVGLMARAKSHSGFHPERDADLPLLTRVFQVNPEDGGSLIDLLTASGVKFWKDDVTQGLVAYYVAHKELPPAGTSALAVATFSLQRVIRLAQRIMLSVQQRGTLTWGDMADLMSYAERVRPPLGSLPPLPSMLADDVNTALLRVPEDRLSYLEERIVLDLQGLVAGATRGEEALSVCAECSSVFVRRRSGVQMCSHRCRRRKESKDNYKKKP